MFSSEQGLVSVLIKQPPRAGAYPTGGSKMSQDRPFVFSFVSVNGTRKVLGTRETMRDEFNKKIMCLLDS